MGDTRRATEHETGPQSAVLPFFVTVSLSLKAALHRLQIYYLDLVTGMSVSVLIMYRRIIEATKRHRCLSIRRV